MHSGVAFLVRVSNYWGYVLLSAAVFVLGAAVPTYALGTSVQTVIDNGDTHPALTLNSPVSPVTLRDMPLKLSGTLASLTQIQVYVDSALSVTIPVDEGATSFSSSVVVASGTHELKLVGISPFADVSPTVSLVVTYATPESQGDETTTNPETSSNPSEASGGIIIGPNVTSTTTTYIPPSQTTPLPGWLYNGLVALDLTKPGDSDGKETIKMVQRFSLATSGTFFLAFSKPTLLLYRRARYAWLGIRKSILPSFAKAHPLAVIRTIGALMISGMFYLV